MNITRRRTYLGICIAILFVSALGLLGPIREYSREQARRRADDRREKLIGEVRNGRPYIVILDVNLLPLLAKDGKCVENLNRISFSSLEITTQDAALMKSFPNIRSIDFYGCQGADHVLDICRSMQIEELGFEMTPLSTESIASLAEFTNLRVVSFLENSVSSNEIAILKQLPPDIELHIDPLAADPAFSQKSGD